MGYGQTPPPGQTLPGYGTGGPAAYGTPPAGAYTQPPIGNVGSVPPPYQPTDQYGQPIPQAGPVAYGSAYPVVATNSLTPLIPGSVVQTAYGPRLVGGKSKLAAGLLGIFLGGLGVGRFYRGFVGLGILQILASLFFGAGVIWGFIEGIIVLVSQPGSPSSLDSEGNLLQ
jgi:hypothetical protein